MMRLGLLELYTCACECSTCVYLQLALCGGSSGVHEVVVCTCVCVCVHACMCVCVEVLV